MKASRCACNSINVTQIYVSTIYFILKQGYMFRLEVSHLQALAILFVTTTELAVEYPVNINALLRKDF